jgi:hypothetical protein
VPGRRDEARREKSAQGREDMKISRVRPIWLRQYLANLLYFRGVSSTIHPLLLRPQRLSNSERWTMSGRHENTTGEQVSKKLDGVQCELGNGQPLHFILNMEKLGTLAAAHWPGAEMAGSECHQSAIAGSFAFARRIRVTILSAEVSGQDWSHGPQRGRSAR